MPSARDIQFTPLFQAKLVWGTLLSAQAMVILVSQTAVVNATLSAPDQAAPASQMQIEPFVFFLAGVFALGAAILIPRFLLRSMRARDRAGAAAGAGAGAAAAAGAAPRASGWNLNGRAATERVSAERVSAEPAAGDFATRVAADANSTGAELTARDNHVIERFKKILPIWIVQWTLFEMITLVGFLSSMLSAQPLMIYPYAFASLAGFIATYPSASRFRAAVAF